MRAVAMTTRTPGTTGGVGVGGNSHKNDPKEKEDKSGQWCLYSSDT